MSSPSSIRFTDVEKLKAAAEAAGMKFGPWVDSACVQVAALEAAERALAAGETQQYLPPQTISRASYPSTRPFKGPDFRPATVKKGKR